MNNNMRNCLHYFSKERAFSNFIIINEIELKKLLECIPEEDKEVFEKKWFLEPTKKVEVKSYRKALKHMSIAKKLLIYEEGKINKVFKDESYERIDEIYPLVLLRKKIGIEGPYNGTSIEFEKQLEEMFNEILNETEIFIVRSLTGFKTKKRTLKDLSVKLGWSIDQVKNTEYWALLKIYKEYYYFPNRENDNYLKWKNRVQEFSTDGRNHISSLKLSNRVYNALMREGIVSIEQICAMSEEQLLKINRIGEKGISELREKIEKYG